MNENRIEKKFVFGKFKEDNLERILLLNGNSVLIYVAAYSEWGPFKNKIGANLTDDALSFANYIEQKTFDQRKKIYLDTGNNEIY